MKNRKMAGALTVFLSLAIIVILVDLVGSIVNGLNFDYIVQIILMFLGVILSVLYLVCDMIFVLNGNRKFYFASYIVCLMSVLIVAGNDLSLLINVKSLGSFPLLAFIIIDGLLFISYCIPFFSENIKNFAYLFIIILMIIYLMGLFINGCYNSFFSCLSLMLIFSFLVDSIVKLIGSIYEKITIVKE